MNALTEHAAADAAHTAQRLHSMAFDPKNANWHARRLAATPRSVGVGVGVGVMGDFFTDHV